MHNADARHTLTQLAVTGGSSSTTSSLWAGLRRAACTRCHKFGRERSSESSCTGAAQACTDNERTLRDFWPSFSASVSPARNRYERFKSIEIEIDNSEIGRCYLHGGTQQYVLQVRPQSATLLFLMTFLLPVRQPAV